MSGFDVEPSPDHRPSEDPHSVVEYALRVTDTVVWEWDIPEDEVSLYPPSQTVIADVSNVEEFLNLVHPENRRETAAAIERALEGEGSYVAEFRLDGEDERWMRAQGEVEYDETGDPKRLAGVGREITGQKRTSWEFKRLGEHVTETELVSDIGGWEFDLETEELWWSRGMKRMHEVPQEYRPTLADAIEFYHPADRSTIEGVFEQCRDHGDPYSVEVRMVTADGRERWVRAKGDRTRRGGTRLLRGVVQDITDRKIRDQRLMVLNRVLRHNIRNSLNVVMGHADLLEGELAVLEASELAIEEATSFSLEEARHFLSVIDSRADQLVQIAEDARRVSRVLDRDPGRYSVEVTPIVNELVTELSAEYPAATIRADGSDVGVRGNTNALRVALGELVENAIVHTQRKAPTVEIGVSRLEPERVAIRVVDRGPGIPEIERAVLQKGIEEPMVHGHGMGLWMVNWLTVRLSGSISIADNEPRGTVVTLKLPAASRP